MPRIQPQNRPFQVHNHDPYASSDEESSMMSSQYSYSQSSIPSRASRGGGSKTSMSVSSRREMRNLMKNRDALMIAEMQLSEERRRGRWMLFACILLGAFCMVLFKDRWPDGMRDALVKYLDSGEGTEKSSSESNGAGADKFLTDHSSNSGAGNKHKTEMQQYSRDDPVSGASTAMSEYLATNNQKHSTASSSNADESFEDATRPRPESASKIIADLTDEQKTANKEAALMEELEQHLDNLSKYLKWNLPYKSDRDVPFYWVIPMSGSSLLDPVLGKCYGLVQAADQASYIKGHEEEKILNVLLSDDGKEYVNVDMGSMGGIKRAQELHLATSNVANLIRSPYVYEVAMLFTGTAKYGKCFTMVRNPIDRAVDVFRNLKSVTTNDVFKEMNLEEYAKSSFMEDNWMVRVLSNEMDGKIEQHHLDLAQHVLGRKCLIGLTEKFNESILRFSHYFDWANKISQDDLTKCEADLEIAKHVENQNFSNADMEGTEIKKEDYKEGTDLYKVLAEKNAFDIELYHYAQGLYHRQALYS